MKHRYFQAYKYAHQIEWVFWAALLVCWSGTSARAQGSAADSLARLLASAPADTHRVNLLVDYAWEINETHTDEANARLQEAIGQALTVCS